MLYLAVKEEIVYRNIATMTIILVFKGSCFEPNKFKTALTLLLSPRFFVMCLVLSICFVLQEFCCVVWKSADGRDYFMCGEGLFK